MLLIFLSGILGRGLAFGCAMVELKVGPLGGDFGGNSYDIFAFVLIAVENWFPIHHCPFIYNIIPEKVTHSQFNSFLLTPNFISIQFHPSIHCQANHKFQKDIMASTQAEQDLNQQQSQPQDQDQAGEEQSHHYPFQGTLNNIFAPKPCDEHESHCNEENQSPVDHMLYHFEYRKWLSQQRASWKDFDHDAAQKMTDLKNEYILSVGDLRLRSTCMFVTAGLTYMAFTIKKPSLLGKLRTFALSFAVNGYIWTPELFNPMLLRKSSLIN